MMAENIAKRLVECFAEEEFHFTMKEFDKAVILFKERHSFVEDPSY